MTRWYCNKCNEELGMSMALVFSHVHLMIALEKTQNLPVGGINEF
jgi:hypothetical protein